MSSGTIQVMEATEKKVGRPRAFEKDSALESAGDVFLKQGFEGCSMDDLTAALGINKPSLYAAFGNKQELFVKVLKKYHSRYCTYFSALTDKNLSPRETITEWFEFFLSNYHSQKSPVGCLIVNSTMLANDDYPEIAAEIKAFHDLNEKLMTDYLSARKEAGEFEGDPVATSQYLNAVAQGMAVLYRTQRKPEALENVVANALRVMD